MKLKIQIGKKTNETYSDPGDRKHQNSIVRLCLNHLLPNKRDPDVISKMRHPTCYPIPYNHTKRYQSFINYALSHYQAQ